MKSNTTSTWDEINLTSASATTITQPQTSAPVLFNLLSSHLNQDQMWPFYQIYSCYLLFAKALASLSSVTTSFGRQVWRTEHSQRNKCFFCLSGIYERKKQRVLMVNQRRGPMLCKKSQKEKRNPCHFFCNFLLPPYNLCPRTQRHSRTLRLGQQRKLRPYGPITSSASLVLRRTVLKFLDLKPGTFCRQIIKIPAAGVACWNQIQMWFNILANNYN